MYSPDLQKLKNLGGYKMMNKHLQQIHFQKLIDVTISTVKRTPVAKIEVLSQGQSVTITITNPYNSTNGEKMTKNDIQKRFVKECTILNVFTKSLEFWDHNEILSSLNGKSIEIA